MNLVTLQFKTRKNYQDNLDTLVRLIKLTEKNSFILAPEVCLTNFDYDNIERVSLFSLKAIDTLLALCSHKYISLTLIVKQNGNFYNKVYLFYNNQIIYTQAKTKLFPLGGEIQHFKAGNTDDIQIIEYDGLKIAFLICFEIRFIELWKQIQGADLICVPAMWGKPRKQNFETLTRALAVANQCYVLASNSCNNDMAGSSNITTPFGEQYLDDSKEILSLPFDFKLIKKMRRYLDVGIK